MQASVVSLSLLPLLLPLLFVLLLAGRSASLSLPALQGRRFNRAQRLGSVTSEQTLGVDASAMTLSQFLEALQVHGQTQSRAQGADNVSSSLAAAATAAQATPRPMKRTTTTTTTIRTKAAAPETMAALLRALQVHLAQANDLQVAVMCNALGQMGVTSTDLLESGTWKSVDRRLAQVATSNLSTSTTALLLNLLKALASMQIKWHHLSWQSKKSFTTLLTDVLGATDKVPSPIVVRTILISLGGLQAGLQDLPDALRALVLSASKDLLKSPSPSSHHIIYALSNMRVTISEVYDRAELAVVKSVLSRSFSVTPRYLRFKIVAGMAGVGFKWASLDVNLRRAVEEHVQSYADLSARQFRAGEIHNIVVALRAMGVHWSMLQLRTREALPLAFSRTFKRMTPREVSGSLLALSGLRPGDDALCLYDFVSSPATANGGDQAHKQLHRYFGKQAVEMNSWERNNFANALLSLGASQALVESLALGLGKEGGGEGGLGGETVRQQKRGVEGGGAEVEPRPHLEASLAKQVTVKGGTVTSDRQQSTSSKKLTTSAAVLVDQIQRKVAVATQDPVQLPAALHHLVELFMGSPSKSRASPQDAQVQLALRPLNSILSESIPSWEHDEIKVCLALNALSKLYVGGFSLYSNKGFLSSSTVTSLLSLLMRQLPTMTSRAASNTIFFIAKMRFELRNAPSYSAFVDLASSVFFDKSLGMAGQGEFCNSFFALAQLWKATAYSVKGGSDFDDDQHVGGGAKTLPPLLTSANVLTLQDALVHHSNNLNARDIATFAGTLRSLSVRWVDLPSGLSRTLAVKVDDCVADMDAGSLSLVLLSLGSMGVELSALSTVTRVRIRQQLSLLLMTSSRGDRDQDHDHDRHRDLDGATLTTTSSRRYMSSRELYWCLCGLGRMKVTWADFPTYLQDALRISIKAHALSRASSTSREGVAADARAVIALLKGLCSVKATWAGDIDIGSPTASSNAVLTMQSTDDVENPAPALISAFQRVIAQDSDDATFSNLILFLRKLKLTLLEYPALLSQVVSRMDSFAPFRATTSFKRKGAADGARQDEQDVDTSNGRGYEALPALLRELRGLGVSFKMLRVAYIDRALRDVAAEQSQLAGRGDMRRKQLTFLTHTCRELGLMGATWSDFCRLPAPTTNRSATDLLIAAATATATAISATDNGRQPSPHHELTSQTLAEVLAHLGYRPVSASINVKQVQVNTNSIQRQQQSASVGQNENVLLKLTNRLPSLSDKDLLRAIYLLGARKFPRSLLVGGVGDVPTQSKKQHDDNTILTPTPVLRIIDERITGMFPEMGPVALVAVLGSLHRLELEKEDLPLSGDSILTHLSSLASSLDRRTLLAAIRALVQLKYAWGDLSPSQQAGLAAGLARAATAKPTCLASLLQELHKFQLYWPELHKCIPIVLRYVVFHVFTQAYNNEREVSFLLGGESADNDSGGGSGGGGDGVSSGSGSYTLEVCGELLVEMVRCGAEGHQLGKKATVAIFQAMTLKSQLSQLSQAESRALQDLVRSAPQEVEKMGANLQFYIEDDSSES